MSQLLTLSDEDETFTSRVRMFGDGGVSHKKRLGLKLPKFSGEPDGGMAWYSQKYPLFIIEIGVSDSNPKTRARVQHWLLRGGGKVTSSWPPLLINSDTLWICNQS